MGIRINFDTTNNPECPTLVLANRSGNKIGGIKAKNISINDCLNSAPEISFTVYKYVDDVRDYLWDKIVDLKLVWVKEWDTWFEIRLDINESDDISKVVRGIRLGESELSQVLLFNIEINTENDILREDYKPTVFYNAFDPDASLLHRMMEKVPHYRIIHVDSTIAGIQRTFTFDKESLYDSFQKVAEEIGCLFVFHSNSDEDLNIQRTISVYDLESNCKSCGYRGEFTGVCPECGSTDIDEGYGEDTTIFISSDELANELTFTTDVDATKNCFRLQGGDDMMTATIRNCNPNGSDYIWHITDYMKEDMSPELVEKLEAYDELYRYYQYEYISELDSGSVSKYNALVDKYSVYDHSLEKIVPPIVGYPALMMAYYNTINLATFLQSVLMPNAKLSDANAEQQAKLITSGSLSPVAVTNLQTVSEATANNAVLGMARVIVDARYQVKILSSSLSGHTWTGAFTVTNYSDQEDTAVTGEINVDITDEYEAYLKQKIEKALVKSDTLDHYGIVSLFEKSYDDFCNEIKKYCLDSLSGFEEACQGCIDVLIEQGVGNSDTWAGTPQDLYNQIYLPYYNKLKALESEMSLRQSEIDIILGTYNSNNDLVADGIQTEIIDIKNMIQDTLDFQKYLGEDLWLEFCAYRRDGEYTNSNYISDGLSNSELFGRAMEFMEVASRELYKSAELQHSISTSLKNLLILDKFKPLVKYFSVGNWLRVQVDDTVYKLRLVEYGIDYEGIETISVQFSDVLKVKDGISDVSSVLNQARSMATSYDTVQRQSALGAKGNSIISEWFEKGLDATNTKLIGGADNQSQVWDEHGMLFRRYDPISDTFDDIQMKIVNSTIAITNDNWKTVKTAVGQFYYVDPMTGQTKSAYGINGEVLIGKLIIGESLGIYNNNNSLTFDQNGLTVTNGTNKFVVDPTNQRLFRITKGDKNVIWLDESGNANFSGKIAGGSIDIGNGVFTVSESGDTNISGNHFSWNNSYSSMTKEGKINLKEAHIEGEVVAGSGKIGGFTINADGSLKGNGASINFGDMLYIGNDGISMYDHKMEITSDSILIGDFSIDENGLWLPLYLDYQAHWEADTGDIYCNEIYAIDTGGFLGNDGLIEKLEELWDYVHNGGWNPGCSGGDECDGGGRCDCGGCDYCDNDCDDDLCDDYGDGSCGGGSSDCCGDIICDNLEGPGC